MKTRIHPVAVLVGLALSISVLSACFKNRYDKSDAPKYNAMAETYFGELSNIADQAISGNLYYYKSGTVILDDVNDGKPLPTVKTPCSVLISFDTVGTLKTITVDWGNTNCDCNDGKRRRGQLIITYTGSYFSPGTVITHTPVDYYVNDHKLEGSKIVTNMGLNSNGQPYYTVDINGVLTLSTSEVINYTSDRVRTFVSGFSTPLNFWDDEYDITGSATATVTNGDGFTANILSPLRVAVGCAYIKQGTIEITPTDKPARTIDYGDGSCDGTFTISVNGNTYTIVL
jgi:hypothetical protein